MTRSPIPVVVALSFVLAAQGRAQTDLAPRSPEDAARLLGELSAVPLPQPTVDGCTQAEAKAKQAAIQAATPSSSTGSAMLDKGAAALNSALTAKLGGLSSVLGALQPAAPAPAAPAGFRDGLVRDNCLVDAKLKAKDTLASVAAPPPSVPTPAWPSKLRTLPEYLASANETQRHHVLEEGLVATADPYVFAGRGGGNVFVLAPMVGLFTVYGANDGRCYSTGTGGDAFLFFRDGNMLEPTATCPRLVDSQRKRAAEGGDAPPGALASVATPTVASDAGAVVRARPIVGTPIAVFDVDAVARDITGIGWTKDEISAFSWALIKLRGGGTGIPVHMKLDDSAELWAYVRAQPHFTDILGRLAVAFAKDVASGRQQDRQRSTAAALDSMVRLCTRFPETDRLQFRYATLDGARSVLHAESLEQMLLDGAWGSTTRASLVPRLASEDVGAFETMRARADKGT